MRLLIKFPTRNRPNKFLQTLNRYIKFMEGDNQIIISIDNDDEVMKDADILEYLNSLKNVTICFGDNKSKIEAVNANIPEDGWDVLLLASDDMIPMIKGYDRIIKEKMGEYFPDTDGILFFNDGFQGDKLNTLCILGKKYYDRFKYIYNPEYISCWSDNEFMLVGNILGKQKYFEDVIIKHEHPDYGYGDTDNVHQLNLKYYQQDMEVFNKRQKNNFGL